MSIRAKKVAEKAAQKEDYFTYSKTTKVHENIVNNVSKQYEKMKNISQQILTKEETAMRKKATQLENAKRKQSTSNKVVDGLSSLSNKLLRGLSDESAMQSETKHDANVSTLRCPSNQRSVIETDLVQPIKVVGRQPFRKNSVICNPEKKSGRSLTKRWSKELNSGGLEQKLSRPLLEQTPSGIMDPNKKIPNTLPNTLSNLLPSQQDVGNESVMSPFLQKEVNKYVAKLREQYTDEQIEKLYNIMVTGSESGSDLSKKYQQTMKVTTSPAIRKKMIALEICMERIHKQRLSETFDAVDALNCRYLRLTKETIAELEEACRKTGTDPGMHGHLTDAEDIVDFVFGSETKTKDATNNEINGGPSTSRK